MTAPSFFGSGSSSTLSPLAPPFTFDRSAPKLQANPQLPPSHPFIDFTDYSAVPSANNSFQNHPPSPVSDSSEGHRKVHAYSGSESQSLISALVPSNICSYVPGKEGVSYGSFIEAEPYYQRNKFSLENPSSNSLLHDPPACTYSPISTGSLTCKYSDERNNTNSCLPWKVPQNAANCPSCTSLMNGGGLQEASGVWHGESGNCFASDHGSSELDSGLLYAKASASSEIDFMSCHLSPATYALNSNLVTHEVGVYQEPKLVPSTKMWKLLDPPLSERDDSYMRVESGLADPTVLKPSNVSYSLSSQATSHTNLYFEMRGTQTAEVGPSHGEYNNISQNNGCSPPAVCSITEEAMLIQTTRAIQHLNKLEADECCITAASGTADESLISKLEIKEKSNLTDEPLKSSSPMGHNEPMGSHLNQLRTRSCGTASFPSSLEAHDLSNQVVDSPCWKGVPVSHATFAISLPKFSKPCTGEAVDDPLTLSSQQQHESLTCHGSENMDNYSSLSLLNCTSTACIPLPEQRPVVPDKPGPFSSNDQSNEEVQSHGGIRESSKPPGRLDVETSDKIYFKQICLKEGASFSSSLPHQDGRHVSSEFSSRRSAPTEISELGFTTETARRISTLKDDIKFLIKMIHNLSELLLSSYHDCDVFESDYETLRLVIKNLVACVLLQEKATSSMRSGTLRETASHFLKACSRDRFQYVESPGQSIFQQALSDFPEKSKKLHELEKNPDGSSRVAAEKDVCLMQAVKKALKNSLHDSEETISHALLYKNLWIEAEASLCCMKYELQLTNMKIKMQADEHSTKNDSDHNCIVITDSKTVPGTVESSATIPASVVLETPFQSADIDRCMKPNGMIAEEIHQSGRHTEVDDVSASVMTRFRILQDRTGQPNYMSEAELEQGLDSFDSSYTSHMGNTIVHPTHNLGKINSGIIHQRIELPALSLGTIDDDVRMMDMQVLEDEQTNANLWASRRCFPFVNPGLEDTKSNAGEKGYLVQDCLINQDHPKKCEPVFVKALTNKSYLPGFTSHDSLSRSPTSSSDWEHVLKEELAWHK